MYVSEDQEPDTLNVHDGMRQQGTRTRCSIAQRRQGPQSRNNGFAPVYESQSTANYSVLDRTRLDAPSEDVD